MLLNESKKSSWSANNSIDVEDQLEKNAWIIKPGESSNCGNGIQVAATMKEIKDII